MTIKNEIEKIIKEAIKKEYHNFNGREIYDTPLLIEIPKDKTYGDYSTNIAFTLSKALKKSPIEIARAIVQGIKSLAWPNKGVIEKVKFFEKIKVADPGFINFYLSKNFFTENLKEVLKEKNKYGANPSASLRARKVIIEYTNPNILKDFHIGHLMSNTIGESLSRIFEFQGAKVKRANYQGDVGLHVAKAIWGKTKKPGLLWQDAYAFGSEKYEINDAAKKEITELNNKVFKKSDKKINKLYEQGRKESLKNFEQIYKKVGTEFDYYFFESEVAGFGREIVESGLKKGIFEKGEKGAIVFKGEKFGLHTRVFVNSQGLPTYEAKELGLANVKYKKYKYNTSVVVTGNEINEYFKVLLCAMSQIFPELSKKTKHIGHGMMRLPEGKMSSRTGKVITATAMIEKAKEMVLKKISDRDLKQSEKEKIAEKVAIAAIKYSILKQSIGSDIIFDFEKSISFEGDSGPYLQYSYARAMSVLKKAKAEGVNRNANIKYANDTSIGALEKMIIYFPEIVEKAGKEYEPHFIVLYLTELAREFNNYYAKNKIVDKADEFSPYKVAITKVFSIIMRNGMWLLGIEALNKM